MALVSASDGLPAREVHAWSDEKLFYVERYMDIFSVGMKHSHPAYVDLFSGPGLCVEEDSRRETHGSPLRAAAFPNFKSLFFNDLDTESVAALRQRLARLARPGIIVHQADCNEAALEARRLLFSGSRPPLGLAFIDPPAFQIRFDTLRAFTEGLRIDLIITFMTGYIRRNLDLGANLDAFMGTAAWRDSSKSTRQILDLYEGQLKSIGYDYVDDDIRITNSRESTLYHLVFASKHPRGLDFFRKISGRRYNGQRRMSFD